MINGDKSQDIGEAERRSLIEIKEAIVRVQTAPAMDIIAKEDLTDKNVQKELGVEIEKFDPNDPTLSEKVRERLNELKAEGKEIVAFYDKNEELKAMDICCDAVIILGERYHKLALEKAEAETDPVRKAEILQIAKNLEVVPAHAPQTYWQAIQLYWFTHLAVTTELNPWDAFSPGRMDQHLIKYYEADTEAGILDDEKALELLECLWVKFYNQPAPVKVGITLKESATYTDFANINTGGVTPTGENGVNAVSYLILDCMDDMKLVQPNSNVTISKKTPQRFLRRACEISRKGWGQPAFYNTEAQIMELINAGKTL